MISSKALIDQTGISRATLNNYIQLGILPKPVVQSLAANVDEGGARLLGFFPDDALERVYAVQQLKAEGCSMAQVAERLSQTDALIGLSPSAIGGTATPSRRNHTERKGHIGLDKAPSGLSLSLDNLIHPAYMLNYNLELTWLNESARQDLFGFEAPPARSEQRNLLQLLARSEARLTLADQRALSRLHLRMVGARITREALVKMVMGADPELLPLLDEIEPVRSPAEQTITETEVFRSDRTGNSVAYRVFAVYFREGILVVHEPDTERADDLLRFLGRRDQVIQSLLSKRLPVMTPLAVLVADLQNSVRICSELPPDEYFELINQIWSTMGPILRKYTGTHGKHVGDGVVYYFFPQPESNYLFNSIACANELRAAMRNISSEWQLRKNWFTELQLNIGLHEGQEWLGTFQSANHVEFAVLGNTINQAARLSDFARQGSIWASKSLLSKLTAEERSLVEFGVTRKSEENGDRFVTSCYAQVESLVDLRQDRFEKLRDIAQLAVAEVRRFSLSRQY